MHDHMSVTVSDTGDDLLEELSSLVLGEPTVLDDMIEQLAARHILHDHEDVRGRVDHLVELDDVRVSEELEVLDLATDLSDHVKRLDLVAVEDLYGHCVTCQLVACLFHLAEASCTKCLQ